VDSVNPQTTECGYSEIVNPQMTECGYSVSTTTSGCSEFSLGWRRPSAEAEMTFPSCTTPTPTVNLDH
jgi:hypothetical protein